MKYTDDIKINTVYEFSNDFNELEGFVIVLDIDKTHKTYKVLVYDVEYDRWHENNYGKPMFVGPFKQEINKKLFNIYKYRMIINAFK